MPQVILLFGLDGVIGGVVSAIKALQRRKPELARFTAHQLLEAWCFDILYNDHNLALRHHPAQDLMPLLDAEFHEAVEFERRCLNRQLSVTLHPSIFPYYGDWARLTVGLVDLWLTYSIGPVDYSTDPRALRKS